MSVIISEKPYTAWNLLDYFIVQLSKENEKICNNRISSDLLYNTLVDVVCQREPKELIKRVVITKPFYPFILLTYYTLFHMNNLNLTETLLKRLLEIYLESRAVFDKNEEFSLNIMRNVIELFSILRGLNKEIHEKALALHLEVLVAKLDRINCDESEWGCLFKELVTSNIEPDLKQSYRRLSTITEKCKRRTELIIEEELIEGYNLFMTEVFSPIYTFILNTAESKLEKIRHLYEKINELEREKDKINKKLNSIRKIQRKLHTYAEEANKWYKKVVAHWPFIGSMALWLGIAIAQYFGITIPKISIVLPVFSLSPYLLRVIEFMQEKKLKHTDDKINQIRNSRIENLVKVIWLQKPHNISNSA